MAEPPKPYTPYQDLRFYPGANISEERKQALAALEVEPDQLTADDIAWNLGAFWTRSTYVMWNVVRDRFGDEVAKQVAEEYGYRLGKTNLLKWMKAHGLTRMTPEQFARFQDNRHALGGARHAESYITYDDDKVVLWRTGCGYHDNRPEDSPSFCQYSCLGFFRAYAEVDPQIEVDQIVCKSKGNSADHCETHFRFKKP